MKCEQCNNERDGKYRFCKRCRKIVMAEMKESGYLQPQPEKQADGMRGRKVVKSDGRSFESPIKEDNYGENSEP